MNLKKIKLNAFEESILKDREMNQIRGGASCQNYSSDPEEGSSCENINRQTNGSENCSTTTTSASNGGGDSTTTPAY